MSDTPRLVMPVIENQVEAHVALNEGLQILDALVCLNIISSLATPPGSPSNGDTYYVIATASGAWAGKEGKIAVYNGGWFFITPFTGLLSYWSSAGALYVWMGSRWESKSTVSSALTDGANIATDAALADCFTVTLAGNRTMDPPTHAVSQGQIITYCIKQDGTGSRTITWSSSAGGFRFGGAGTPTLTTTANKTDYVQFIYNASASKWDYLNSKLNY